MNTQATEFVQLDLFNTQPAEIAIEGLEYIKNFITKADQQELLSQIDTMPWIMDLKRRVQHYGYRYNYKSRSVNQAIYLGELPSWAMALAERFCQLNYSEILFDQVIVNEYKPGQGISAHIDCESCFGDTIISLSLGSTCVINFTTKNHPEKKSLLLDTGSLLVLKGDARYRFLHSIPPRQSDLIMGQKLVRNRRVSLTFRKVLFDNL